MAAARTLAKTCMSRTPATPATGVSRPPSPGRCRSASTPSGLVSRKRRSAVGVDEREHRHDAAVGSVRVSLAILTADIGPADEVARRPCGRRRRPPRAGGRARDRRQPSTRRCAARACPGSSRRLRSRIDHRDERACSRRSPDRSRRRDRRGAGMKRLELAGQHALGEPPVAGAQHRAAVGASASRSRPDAATTRFQV